MSKCAFYIELPCPKIQHYGRCMGTKNCEICSCNGDESKCDFYPEKRNKKMNTLDMMIAARENGKSYKVGDMIYNRFNGFHYINGEPWDRYAFKTLNELFSIDGWQEDNAIRMTKSQAEEKYGIKIV